MGIAQKPTLLDVRRSGEYATKFRWSLSFLEPPSFMTDPGYLKQLNVLCQSANLPTKTVEPMTIAVRGHKHFQPGRVVPAGTLPLNFYETVNNQIHQLFWYWQESIWAHNIGVGLSYDELIAESIVITRLSNNDTPICNYVLKWCFLEGYTNPQLSGATSGPYQTGITLSYNDFYIVGPGNTAFDVILRNETASYVTG